MSKEEHSTNGSKTILKDKIGNFPQSEIRTKSTESLCYMGEVKHNIVNQLDFNEIFFLTSVKFLKT